MKPVIYHDAAIREYRKAARFYERRQVGDEFQRRIQEAEAKVRETPRLYARFEETECQGCFVDRFPFALYYIEQNDHIFVVAVANLRRKPGYWVKRLKSL